MENLALLRKWFEDCDEPFLEELLEYLRTRIADLIEKASRNIFTGGKKVQEEIDGKINSHYFNILVFYSAYQDFEKVEDREIMENHLLRTIGNDLINTIVSALATENCIQCDAITTSNRNSILNKLPSTVSKALEKLIKCINGKNVEEFLKEVYSTTEKLQIELKKI